MTHTIKLGSVTLTGPAATVERVAQTLQKPAIGKGGFQDLFRAMQGDLGINFDPTWENPYATRQSNAGGFQGQRQSRSNNNVAPAVEAVPETSQGWDAIGTIRRLLKQGEHV